jgi:hypothetical protein
MRIGIVIAAAVLALTGLAAWLDVTQAQAAPNICTYRYNLCLARCQAASRRCARCRQQYRYCIAPYPSLGNLL